VVTSLQPVNFIDIHTHILPGIDDGARDLAESLLIIKAAIGAGVKELVLTPHFPYGGVEMNMIFHRFELFGEAVSQRGLDITLHLGLELMLCPELPKLIKDDKRLTINGKGKYALIEMPSYEIPIYAPTVFFDMLAHGITPVWAHPERCHDVVADCRVAYRYRDNGVLLQINAGSLLGVYGKKIRHTAATLLKNDCGNIVASDVHRVNGVKTLLLPGVFSQLVRMVGNAKAVKMVLSAPAKVIHDC
jgi:protein-tyrosine phosphatase